MAKKLGLCVSHCMLALLGSSSVSSTLEEAAAEPRPAQVQIIARMGLVV